MSITINRSWYCHVLETVYQFMTTLDLVNHVLFCWQGSKFWCQTSEIMHSLLILKSQLGVLILRSLIDWIFVFTTQSPYSTRISQSIDYSPACFWYVCRHNTKQLHFTVGPTDLCYCLCAKFNQDSRFYSHIVLNGQYALFRRPT